MNELLNWGMLGTLAGLSLATVIITSVVSDAFGVQKRWFALVVAALLSVLGTVFNTDLSGASNMVMAWTSVLSLAIINAFVVYTSATGINSIWASGKQASLPQTGNYGGGGDGEVTIMQDVPAAPPATVRTAERWW